MHGVGIPASMTGRRWIPAGCASMPRAPIDAVARANALFNGGRDLYVPLVSRSWPGYSPELLAAIDAALAFQPSNRPQDVAAWIALLPPRPEGLPAWGECIPGAAESGTRVEAPGDGATRRVRITEEGRTSKLLGSI